MKKLLYLSLILLFSFTASGQTLTYEGLQGSTKRPKAVRKVQEYITKDGESFKVGDTVTLGRPLDGYKYFEHIHQVNFLAGTSEKLPSYGYAGERFVVRRFYAGKSRWGGKGYYIQMKIATTGLEDTIIDLEQALETGEIITGLMSREQAIAKLKESKDLFDLGLLTESEYEKIKTELTPIIMDKK